MIMYIILFLLFAPLIMIVSFVLIMLSLAMIDSILETELIETLKRKLNRKRN